MQGKRMKLYVFENAVYKPKGDPFPGFLVRTDDNFNILIDTGITPEDAKRLNGSIGANDVVVGESRLPLNILGTLGLAMFPLRVMPCGMRACLPMT
jgi:hypothetical protein